MLYCIWVWNPYDSGHFWAPNTKDSGNTAVPVLVTLGLHFSVDEVKQRLLETTMQTRAFTCWLAHDASSPDSSYSHHVTLFQKKIIGPSLDFQCVDKELQALWTWLSSLAAVVKLNFPFYNATICYMCRRQAIPQAICN